MVLYRKYLLYQKIFHNICRIIVNPESQIDSNDTVFDENILYEYLQYHQISSFIYYYKQEISKICTGLSKQIFDRCHNDYLQNIYQGMIHENYLKNNIKLLKQNKLPFYIIKGIVSAKELYIKEELRSYSDLDIVIHKKDLKKWLKYLSSKGFVRTLDHYTVFPNSIINKYNFSLHFINEKPNPIAIDLHLNLSNKMHPFQFDIEEFINHSRSINLTDKSINTFQPEYLIIFYLYHSFKHYYFKIIWFIDLYFAFKTYNIDFEKLHKLLVKYKLEKLWRLFLEISRDLFGDIPFSKKEKLFTDYMNHKRHKIINSKTIINGEFPYSESINRLILPLYYLSNPTDKIKYLFHQFFPPKETLRDFYENPDIKMTQLNYLKFRLKTLMTLTNKPHE